MPNICYRYKEREVRAYGARDPEAAGGGIGAARREAQAGLVRHLTLLKMGDMVKVLGEWKADARLGGRRCDSLAPFASRTSGNQAAFARNAGVDRATINKILSGRAPLQPKILRALNVRMVFALASKNEPPRKHPISRKAS
jgi:hypothetical protein